MIVASSTNNRYVYKRGKPRKKEGSKSKFEGISKRMNGKETKGKFEGISKRMNGKETKEKMGIK